MLFDSYVQLSIITVVRNDVVRLVNTVSSLEAYYANARYEHIVIDSCSIDGTVELLECLSNKYSNISYISESDLGIYDGMNKGVERASGRYLLFLNCGDKILVQPDVLSAWMESYAENQAFSMAFFCCMARSARGLINRLEPGEIAPYKLPASHQATLYSTSFVKSNKYNVNYKIAADYDLYLRAANDFMLVVNCHWCLTEIEARGVASENPILSYGEYFAIARQRLLGWTKIKVLCYIVSRGFLVILYKKFFRKVFGNPA